MARPVLTSSTSPIRVDFLPPEALLVRGRLGMTIAPGKTDPAALAGAWQRELDADLTRLRDVWRCRTLVSLIEDHELDLLGIPRLFARAGELDLRVLRHPIPDGGVPRAVDEVRPLVDTILDDLAGRNVVVHCRGGLGRTGTIAACVLVEVGWATDEAIRIVRTARPGAIETVGQEAFVRAFAEKTAPRRHAHPRPELGRVTGSLLGGAMGDALGLPIEFDDATVIARKMPAPPEHLARPAHVSDDTQMTLFTAEALVRARHVAAIHHGTPVLPIVHAAYQRWLSTQESAGPAPTSDGWLLADTRLWALRAPGQTCLGALRANRASGRLPTIEAPPNDSKGCGAIMRSAPFGLALPTREVAFHEARDAALLTHGHPSGYLSAAYFAALIHDVARGVPLEEAMALADALLARETDHEETARAVHSAREAAKKGPPDIATITQVGAGWVGEEALAIALVCALTADVSSPDGVRTALWRSVAHAGDSDSTGSLTGNLVGAIVGTSGLPRAWREEVELADAIERLARDLFASGVLGTELDFEAYPAR